VKFLPSFGAKDVAPAPGDVPVSETRVGMPYKGSWNLDRAVRDALLRVTWIFRAVHAIASNQAGLPIVVRQGDRFTGDPIDDHFALPLLNRSPNEIDGRYGGAWAFRYRLSALMLLNPRGQFVEIVPDNLGRPVSLHHLPPTYVHPVPDRKKFVSKFVLDMPGVRSRDIDPDHVLWFRYAPHPIDPYDGMTPLQAAGIAVDTDWLARLYNRRFLQNDGRPGGILAIDGDADDDVIKELRQRFSGGVNGAGRVSVLEAEDAKFVDTAITPRDAQYAQLRSMSRDECYQAFGVPESVAGNAAGRTFDNADAELRGFWMETQRGSHLPTIGAGFDPLDDDPETFVGFDLSGIDVLQRSERQRAEFEMKEVEKGLRSTDEYRENRPDLEPIGTPEAQELRVRGTGATGEILEQSRKPADRKQLDVDEIDDMPAPGTYEIGGDDDPYKSERKARDRRSRVWESTVEKQMRAFFGRQESVVLDKLNSSKVRKGTRHWTGAGDFIVNRKIAAQDVLDLSKWNDELEQDARNFVSAIALDYGDSTADALGTSFDLADPRVTTLIEQRVNKIVDCNQTTYDAIKQQLAAGEQAGESLDEIVKRIKGVFEYADTTRAKTIARTEVISSSNGASYEAAKQSNVVAKKQWLTAADDRVRETHENAEGQKRDLDDSYTVGSSSLQYPGDPGAAGEETINCRCTSIFIRTRVR
jgi:HK97 family phage portal protein